MNGRVGRGPGNVGGRAALAGMALAGGAVLSLLWSLVGIPRS